LTLFFIYIKTEPNKPKNSYKRLSPETNRQEIKKVPNGVYKNGMGGFKIENILSDDAWMDARSHAPGWDIHHLAGIYNENINSGKQEKPHSPNKAFPVWCKKYTKGIRP